MNMGGEYEDTKQPIVIKIASQQVKEIYFEVAGLKSLKQELNVSLKKNMELRLKLEQLEEDQELTL